MIEKLNGFNEVKLDKGEEFEEITGERRDFPKYTTQLLNIANQNAQATRPRVVGQVSDMIRDCPRRTYEGWKEWYMEKYSERLDKAFNKLMPMVKKMRKAMDKIDEEMVREWVEDLVIDKTAEGLIIQEIILKELAERKGTKYRLASPEEESKNIDGYVGSQPVSVKPVSYMSKKPTTRENIKVPVVYYKKTNKYLKIYYRGEDLT